MAEENEKPATRRARSMPQLGVTEVRTRAAQLLWVVCVVFALFLALAALTYALKANPANGLVDFVRGFAGAVDLGVFTLDNGIKQFKGANAEIKDALFNYGLGALFWLVIGRVLERVVRP